MSTALGPKFPTMAKYGCLMLIPVGRPIEMAAGSGSRIGVGLGFLMSLGVGRLITTAAGSTGKDRGLGGLVRFIRLIARFGPLHTFPSSDLAEEWVSASGLGSAPLAGCR